MRSCFSSEQRTLALLKQFYADHGFTVAKSYGRKYVQFDADSNQVKLALYGRRALAKDAGVSMEGGGSHRIIVGSDAGPSSIRMDSRAKYVQVRGDSSTYRVSVEGAR